MWEMHILNRSSSPNMSNSSNKNTDISCGIIEKSTGELLSNGVMAFPGMQGNSGVSKSSNNSVIVHNNNLSNYGTSSSNGSLTPPELPNSVSPTPVLMSHPAMRGLKNKAVGLTSPPLSGKIYGFIYVSLSSPIILSLIAYSEIMFQNFNREALPKLISSL